MFTYYKSKQTNYNMHSSRALLEPTQIYSNSQSFHSGLYSKSSSTNEIDEKIKTNNKRFKLCKYFVIIFMFCCIFSLIKHSIFSLFKKHLPSNKRLSIPGGALEFSVTRVVPQQKFFVTQRGNFSCKSTPNRGIFHRK